MGTEPIRCPNCGTFLRVAVQPSQITILKGRLQVEFDKQNVAHICKEK